MDHVISLVYRWEVFLEVVKRLICSNSSSNVIWIIKGRLLSTCLLRLSFALRSFSFLAHYMLQSCWLCWENVCMPIYLHWLIDVLHLADCTYSAWTCSVVPRGKVVPLSCSIVLWYRQGDLATLEQRDTTHVCSVHFTTLNCTGRDRILICDKIVLESLRWFELHQRYTEKIICH